MAKNAKRVAAGKRAWAKLSASVKASRIAHLKRHSKGSTSQSRGQSMAKKNGNGKQGVVSWLTSVIATLMGVSPVIMSGIEASKAASGAKWELFMESTMRKYTGFSLRDNSFVAKRMIAGYAPLGGAIAFKKATSYLVKVAPIKSLIPRLR